MRVEMREESDPRFVAERVAGGAPGRPATPASPPPLTGEPHMAASVRSGSPSGSAGRLSPGAHAEQVQDAAATFRARRRARYESSAATGRLASLRRRVAGRSPWLRSNVSTNSRDRGIIYLMCLASAKSSSEGSVL